MNYIEHNIEKFRPYLGKAWSVGDLKNIYFFQPEDINMKLMSEIYDQLEDANDEYGDDFEIENYKVIACNGVSPGGRIKRSGISEILALNLETFRVVRISNQYHETTYESVDDFLKLIRKKEYYKP